MPSYIPENQYKELIKTSAVGQRLDTLDRDELEYGQFVLDMLIDFGTAAYAGAVRGKLSRCFDIIMLIMLEDLIRRMGSLSDKARFHQHLATLKSVVDELETAAREVDHVS
jgi:hypothetical protein